MNNYIFGYGSLINLESLYKTIGRRINKDELIVTALADYSRIWNYKANVFSACLKKNIDAVYLNLTESKGNSINGIVFQVTDSEMKNLNKREKYYKLVEVTDSIQASINARIYTYICNDIEHIADTVNGSYVMQKYIDIVVDGCKEFGDIFKEEFIKTIKEIPFEIVEGDYSFI